jgi:hypothetical protein
MRDVWGMPRPADLRAYEASDPVGHYSAKEMSFIRRAIADTMIQAIR